MSLHKPIATSFLKLPPYGHGQKIGLFGGSFNPVHAGHVHVALTALKSLHLDWLWVLVTPGNPLKPSPGFSYQKRLADVRRILHHPRILVSDFENRARLRFTFDTVRLLRQRAPDAHFVWVMGADNLLSFHAWQNWSEIAQILPIAVIDREQGRFSPLNSKAAQRFSPFRLPAEKAAHLPFCAPPAWVFLHGPHIPLSSTQIRSREDIEQKAP